MVRSRFLVSQSAVTRRRRIAKKTSKSTKRNPQGWALPYAGRPHITPRIVPSTVARVADARIEQLLKQRKHLNTMILISAPRSRSAVAPNYSNLHNQRNKINKKIQKLRAAISHRGYISGPLFASIIRNMNA